ncbi:uncharacterized protein LOC121728463 [Aricia agestis]|uniref:uncharacterized protein LOC121728463 n=1 Tax=Aricia agestis TaxID=91739 RepID=UPI001C20C31D|nr:uncharacterized protein LOC121728463 [Aricia agestis]
MCRIIQIYFLFVQYFMLGICEIPSLTVRKVDSKTIERKRQDTLEMCRMFNEENILPQTAEDIPYALNEHNNRRVKRHVRATPTKPLLSRKHNKVKDVLHNNFQDKKKATNRLRNVTTTKAIPDGKVRRFDFAPATLLPPDDIMSTVGHAQHTDDAVSGHDDDATDAGSIPWIKKWKHGLIPYFINPKSYDSYLADTIISAFDYIEKTTCIRMQRLRERPIDKKSLNEADWLFITNPAGIRQCVHSNERNPNLGVQVVVIGYNCMSLGEIAHEIMHVLGFSHEHTRPDRDRYITVDWNNIKPGYRKYFDLQSENPLTFLPYDYASVLHYPARAFSKNGKLTIEVPAGITIGKRESLSQIDIEKVSTIYGLECVKRNKDYLLKTCPSVVTQNRQKGKGNVKASTEEIRNYFEDRLWTFGVVNYKFKDNVEFSTEEIENIKTVFDHIQKETCIEFRDVTDIEADEYIDDPAPLVIYNNPEFNTSLGDQPSDKQRLELDIDFGEEKNATDAKSKERHFQMSVNAQEEPLNIVENMIADYEAGEPKKVKRRHLASVVNKSSTKHREPTEKRRHSGSILILRRSSEHRCQCPTPGRPNGNKQLEIGQDCFTSVNDLLHFYVHVLGLDHQHNTHDRDSFIHIVWDQLTPDLKAEMEKKYPPAASAGFAYDYQSVMHFPWLQIKDGVTSLMYPIWNDGWAMGHWQGLSATDVKKINKIYERECLERSQQDKFTIINADKIDQ